MTKLEELELAWCAADDLHLERELAASAAGDAADDAWAAYQDELNKQKENSDD